MLAQDINMLVTAPTLSSCNWFIAFVLVDVHSLLFIVFFAHIFFLGMFI